MSEFITSQIEILQDRQNFLFLLPQLRMYMNEYDRSRVSYWPAHTSCVIKQGDPRAASFDKAMKIIKTIGGDQQPPPTLEFFNLIRVSFVSLECISDGRGKFLIIHG